MTGSDAHNVTISGQVIDPHELHRRLAAAVDDVQAHRWTPAPTSAPALHDRAHRLHQLWATVAPPSLVVGSGLRGRLAFDVKRVIRKLSAWYIEPRWTAQREVDAELARFASDAVEAIQRLEGEVERLQIWNERLRRELRHVRRDAEAMPRCP